MDPAALTAAEALVLLSPNERLGRKALKRRYRLDVQHYMAGRSRWPGPNGGGIGAVFILFGIGVAALFLNCARRKLRLRRAGLSATTYLRTTGHVSHYSVTTSTGSDSADTTSLYIWLPAPSDGPGYGIEIPYKLFKKLVGIGWVIITYSLHQHTLIGIVGPGGKVIYGYPRSEGAQ